MKSVLRNLIVLICIIGLVFSITGCTSNNNTVAKVGSEEISSSEFKFFLRISKATIEAEEKIAPEGSDEKALENYQKDKEKYWKKKENLEKLRKKALEEATEFKVQISEAEKNKVSLSETEKTQATENFENNIVQQAGSKEAAETQVKEEYNISLEEIKNIVVDYQIISKFAQTEVKKITIDDLTVKKTYEKDKDKYDSVTVQHILFLTTDDSGKKLSDDKIKEKKKKADEMLEKVKNGEDIKKLAKENSEDPSAAENSGEFTFVKDGQMVKEFEDWSFKAKKGDVGIVETEYGYHVMKLSKRTDIKDEDIKTAVKTSLQQEKYEEKIDSWLKQKEYKLEKEDKKINETDIGKI
ncbi:MAG: peptidylprolyl isomerase [Clostridiales bacterium]